MSNACDSMNREETAHVSDQLDAILGYLSCLDDRLRNLEQKLGSKGHESRGQLAESQRSAEKPGAVPQSTDRYIADADELIDSLTRLNDDLDTLEASTRSC